jgi:hypothetical protein
VKPGATDVVLRLVRPGSITGTVIGLPLARVWLRRSGGITGAASVPGNLRTILARDDHFRFDGLVPGDYTLLAVGAGDTASASVEIAPGTAATVTLAAQPSRRIAGTVATFRAGEPVADTTCVAVPATGELRPPGIDSTLPQRAVTAADGSFTIEHAPAGAALVVCFPPVRFAQGATVVAGDADLASIELATAPAVPMGELGFDLDQTRLHAVIQEVYGDDAEQAGIAAGDRVIAIDGVDVENLYVEGVMWLIGIRPFGSKVTITFERDGASFARSLIVAEPLPH